MARRKYKFPKEPIIGIVVLALLIGFFLLFLPQINIWWSLRDAQKILPPAETQFIPPAVEDLATATEKTPNTNRTSTGRKEPSILQPVNGTGKIIILIDDVGNNIEDLQNFIEFPEPLTFAVLPQLKNTSASVDLILSKGHDVILHQPMTPIGGANPGPGAINLSLSRTEIWNLLDINFSSTSNPPGANNHMGSAVTANPEIMKIIMEYMAHNNKFFLDSRTTTDSVAYIAAQNQGVVFTERDVFLDHNRDSVAIWNSLLLGLEIAKSNGSVILIGHCTVPQLAEALFKIYPEIKKNGFQIISLRDSLIKNMVE